MLCIIPNICSNNVVTHGWSVYPPESPFLRVRDDLVYLLPLLLHPDLVLGSDDDEFPLVRQRLPQFAVDVVLEWLQPTLARTTKQYNTIQYNTIPYNTVQCNATTSSHLSSALRNSIHRCIFINDSFWTSIIWPVPAQILDNMETRFQPFTD